MVILSLKSKNRTYCTFKKMAKILWGSYSSHPVTNTYLYSTYIRHHSGSPLTYSKGILSFKNKNLSLFSCLFFFRISTWMNLWLCYFSRTGRLAHVVDSLIKASLENWAVVRLFIWFPTFHVSSDLWLQSAGSSFCQVSRFSGQIEFDFRHLEVDSSCEQLLSSLHSINFGTNLRNKRLSKKELQLLHSFDY